MKLYRVANKEEYKQVFLDTIEGGSLNIMGEDEPLFSGSQEILDYFNDFELHNEVRKLYDDYEEPIWNEEEELFPSEFFNKAMDARLDSIEMSFPFYVIVSGSSNWDKMGSSTVKTFYEINELEHIVPQNESRIVEISAKHLFLCITNAPTEIIKISLKVIGCNDSDQDEIDTLIVVLNSLGYDFKLTAMEQIKI